MDSQKNQGILELTFSSFSDLGEREETGSERYSIEAYTEGESLVLSWDSPEGVMSMDFRPERVLVLRTGDEASYRMELKQNQETEMELVSPHGSLVFQIQCVDLIWYKDPEFPAFGEMHFHLLYDMLSGGAVMSTRLLAGNVKMNKMILPS